MNSIESIKKILRGQVDGYKALLAVLREERQHLIDFNEPGIQKVSKEKDTLVLKLRLFEQERARLVKCFEEELEAALLSKTEDLGEGLKKIDSEQTKTQQQEQRHKDLTISEISELTGDMEFQHIRSQMKSLMQGIEEFNEFNKFLIDRSLKYLKTTADFLKAIGVSNDPTNKGTILAKEV